MYEGNITKHVRDTQEPLIAYWDRICLALLTFLVDTRTTLIQGFWLQNRLTVMESDAIFFNNEDVSKEFAIDEHYIDPIHNRHVPSFRMVVDYHEGYVVLVYARDEKHLKQIWLVKALSSPKFVQISPNFHPTEVQYCHPSTKDHNVLHTYLGWDTKNNFKWTVDLTYGPIWINTNIILCA